jgi:hypothetical protein
MYPLLLKPLFLQKPLGSARPDKFIVISTTANYFRRFTAQLTSRPERLLHLVKVKPQRCKASCFTTLAGSNPINIAKSEILKSYLRSDGSSDLM